MSETLARIEAFVAYAALLGGDEKGEAQVFCDRLFRAFGHDGYKEAGATLEERIKATGKNTSFADLVWKPRVLIEMKKRGAKLSKHYDQAFNYWLNAVPDRPRFVVLCNFDAFWIYDFDKQLHEPVDKLDLTDLPDRYTALNFLFPHNPKPRFGNDREAVSLVAVGQMTELFKLITRAARPKGKLGQKVTRDQAQRFLLQLVVSLFAEDIDLLPKDTVLSLVEDCLDNKQSSYDLFGGLFNQMNNPAPAAAGRYQGVRYFNGGLFSKIEPIELTRFELELIGTEKGASYQNWSKVNPTIFGSLFQRSMDPKEQHKAGAHYTSEPDIHRIVGPTIVQPWLVRIEAASSVKALKAVHMDLTRFRVLDPACGSGNFLYVAYREMARLEAKVLLMLRDQMTEAGFDGYLSDTPRVGPRQFFGIELDPFGAELTKVTLMLAKKLALDETNAVLEQEEADFSLHADDALPLDNLDSNIKNADALFTPWPDVDAIVGNPPFQSKNKLQQEYGLEYVSRLRDRYPEISGNADYCVYWIRLAHDHLKPGQRAGLVGTNTIRQNYSRESGLDYVVDNGGVITQAVASMIWSGEANLHISVVNWIKGTQPGDKRLHLQTGNDPEQGWSWIDVDRIASSLSFDIDVTKARSLKANAARGGCFQGQTHGHEGFLLDTFAARKLIKDKASYAKVVVPFMIADDLIGERDSKPSRYVIDFHGLDLMEAQQYTTAFKQVKAKVLPDREAAAKAEEDANKALTKRKPNARLNHHHANFLNRWWRLSWERPELISAIRAIPRYIACGCVTKRPIFEFIDSGIHPNAALQVFPYDDDYSFGILQSGIHWTWFTARCSTLTERPRYTSNTVFDSFPWPQTPRLADVKAVADAAVALRALRKQLKVKHRKSLRDIYRTLDLPGEQPLKTAQAKLDAAVRKAYAMPNKADPLTFLLNLNLELAQQEDDGISIQGPGLPSVVTSRAGLVTKDAISA
ncbi:MAG: modification methyltransferase-related protein [Caulobacteraceae bacterium]|nr:modification methyltransferase-related protein [Caulobacteraceae bacterium]